MVKHINCYIDNFKEVLHYYNILNKTEDKKG